MKKGSRRKKEIEEEKQEKWHPRFDWSLQFAAVGGRNTSLLPNTSRTNKDCIHMYETEDPLRARARGE